MKHAQILRSLERIEVEIAKLQAEAAALRAMVEPPGHDVPSGRRPTLAFPNPHAEPSAPPRSKPSVPPRAGIGRAQQASIPIDTIPPASRPGSTPRAPKARDTIPVPPSPPGGVPIAAALRPPPQGTEAVSMTPEGGRYGMTPQPRSRPSRP
jgi:hypothetical protein